MKRATLILSAFLLFAFSPAVRAEMKIGYVDLQAALNKSKAGQAANAKLNEIVAARQKKITEAEVEIKTLQEEIKKQRHLMTEDAVRAKEEEIERKLRDYKRLVTDSQDEIKKREQKLVSGILDELHAVVKKLGKQEGYAAIFEQNASRMLYADEAIDLTDRVVEMYDLQKKE